MEKNCSINVILRDGDKVIENVTYDLDNEQISDEFYKELEIFCKAVTDRSGEYLKLFMRQW